MDKSQTHEVKKKEGVIEEYVLYVSIYIKFKKKQT